jgi:hypothetical protein
MAVHRVALVCVLALAATGCMGGEEGVSTEDYIARADTVCGDHQVQLSRIPRPVTADPRELATYLERALPIAREQFEQLEEIPKPDSDDDRAQVEQLLGFLGQELEVNEAAQQAAAAGDREALNGQLQQGAAFSGEAGRLAEQLGFAVCARG